MQKTKLKILFLSLIEIYLLTFDKSNIKSSEQTFLKDFNYIIQFFITLFTIFVIQRKSIILSIITYHKA